MLQSMGSQRVRHELETEQQIIQLVIFKDGEECSFIFSVSKSKLKSFSIDSENRTSRIEYSTRYIDNLLKIIYAF